MTTGDEILQRAEAIISTALDEAMPNASDEAKRKVVKGIAAMIDAKVVIFAEMMADATGRRRER